MSNNCLVTKLKGVVDNDSLNKLGEVRMMVKLNSNSSITRTNLFMPNDSTPFEVRLLDDGVTFASAIGECQVIDSKHGIITGKYISGGNALVVSGAEPDSWINVSVNNKYKIAALGIYIKDVNLSELKYCTEITALRCNPDYPKYGTFKDLSKMTKMTELVVWADSNIEFLLSGDMSELGVLTSLTSMTISTVYPNRNTVTGSWDDFVAAQKNNGRTTCDSLDIANTYYSTIPFGNRSNIRVGGESEHGILKWDASKMSIQFDTSHKVLTIGYTAEEAAASFTDYEVIMCDPS